MVKHIVMWKLKDVAEGRSKEENAKDIKIRLEKLYDDDPDILYLEVGINLSNQQESYDIILYSEFENFGAFNKYRNFSECVRLDEFISRLKDNKIVVDYKI
jgi:hypothetical protein